MRRTSLESKMFQKIRKRCFWKLTGIEFRISKNPGFKSLSRYCRDRRENIFSHWKLWSLTQKFQNIILKRLSTSTVGSWIGPHGWNLGEKHIPEIQFVTMKLEKAPKMIFVKNYSGMILIFAPSSNVSQLESLLPLFHTSRKASGVPNRFNISTLEITTSFGENKTRLLSTLPRPYFIKFDVDIRDAWHWKIALPASAYSPGIDTLNRKFANYENGTVWETSSRSSVERKWPVGGYYGASDGRFDTVFVVKIAWQAELIYSEKVLFLVS